MRNLLLLILLLVVLAGCRSVESHGKGAFELRKDGPPATFKEDGRTLEIRVVEVVPPDLARIRVSDDSEVHSARPGESFRTPSAHVEVTDVDPGSGRVVLVVEWWSE